MPSEDARDYPRRRLKSARATAGDAGLEAFIGRCLASNESDLYAEAHRQVDRILMTRILEEMGGNQLRSARRLGIGRETLRRRLGEVGIKLNRRAETEPDEEEG